MSDKVELVFVYGTLRSGASNARRMEGAKWLGVRFVRGRMYQIDWYPGLVLDPEGDWVTGEVWEVTPDKLAELDEYEGEEYRRVRTRPAWTKDSAEAFNLELEPQPVWLWEWTGPVDADSRVRTGDWLDVERPRQPPFFTTLGCLSFIVIPGGCAMLLEFVRRVFPAVWEWGVEVVAAGVWLLTPVAAWILSNWAEKRREPGEVLRALTKGFAAIFGCLAAIGALMMIVAWIGQLLG